MFFKYSIFSLGLALLPLVSAEIHDVNVGNNGEFVFEPEAIVRFLVIPAVQASNTPSSVVRTTWRPSRVPLCFQEPYREF